MKERAKIHIKNDKKYFFRKCEGINRALELTGELSHVDGHGDIPLRSLCCSCYWEGVDSPQPSTLLGIVWATENCLAEGEVLPRVWAYKCINK